MKYSWLVISCALILGCVGQDVQEKDQNEPEEARTYQDLTDSEITELVGQLSSVVLYFYSPTCSTCLTVKPLVEELQKEYNLNIIWVSKQENQAIFDRYKVRVYPALYVGSDSEVFIAFDENDSLTRIYSQIQDRTIVGMHRIEYTVRDGQIIIPFDLSPDTLYYFDHDDDRVFVFISPAANLFIISGSEGCSTHWLFLKKGLLYDGENPAQWDKDTLAVHGGVCGALIQIPYTVTGSGIVIAPEDIR